MKNKNYIILAIGGLLIGMILSSILQLLNIPNIFTVILQAIFG